jgi:hypothetical protein
MNVFQECAVHHINRQKRVGGRGVWLPDFQAVRDNCRQAHPSITLRLAAAGRWILGAELTLFPAASPGHFIEFHLARLVGAAWSS